MWQAELAEATIALGKRLLPSAERASIGVANLLEDSGLLRNVFKNKIASGLPELSIDAAGAEAKSISSAVKSVDMHVSSSPDLQLRDIDPGTSWKPKGLWTSDKLDWVPQYKPVGSLDSVKGFAHHVDTSGANILEIRTQDNLQSLIRNYGRPSEFPGRNEGQISLENLDISRIGNASAPELKAFRNSDIDWRAMSKDFDGIRFSGYRNIKDSGPVPSWFDGLDMNSSVTWNNVGKVNVTPLGRVPSYYEPTFQEKLNALISRAGQLQK